jgi:hypothetical protein
MCPDDRRNRKSFLFKRVARRIYGVVVASQHHQGPFDIFGTYQQLRNDWPVFFQSFT